MNKATQKKMIAFLVACTVLFTSPAMAAASTTDEPLKGIENGQLTEEPSYTEDQLRLMSAIIFCEAGAESYNGKVAVGIVVMNRVHSNLFPDSISKVIYQKGQFTPARSGALSRALSLYDQGKFTQKNHRDSIRAAKEALEGRTTLTVNGKETNMSSYLFFSVYLKNCRLRIGHHMFR